MSSNPETIRLQQLQMMGITSYFPRFALPGALPSEPFSWEGVQEGIQEGMQESEITRPAEFDQDIPAVPAWRHEEDTYATEPVATRAPAAPPNRIGNETKEITATNATKETKATRETKPTKDEENAGDISSLHLLLIPVDASLCILNQLPVLAKSLLQEKQQKLLDNILFFLGKHTAAYHSVRTFRWPLPGMSNLTSAKAARSSLMHFLEQFSLENPFGNLLVMGEQGAEWLREAMPQAETTASHLQWQMVQTYSLDQMLTLPAIKREVWHHLLPLQARLKQV